MLSGAYKFARDAWSRYGTSIRDEWESQWCNFNKVDQPYLADADEAYLRDGIEPSLHGISLCSTRIAGGAPRDRRGGKSVVPTGAPDSVRPMGSHPIVGRNVGMAPPLCGQGGHKTTRGSGLPWARRIEWGKYMGTFICGVLGALGAALRAALGAGAHFLITLAGIAVGLGADITARGRSNGGDVVTIGCTLAKWLFTRGGHSRTLVGYVFLFMCLPYVGAVTCIHCKDRFDPSGRASENCPTITVVAANVAAAAAGTYALVNLEKILPDYVIRLFPRAAIRALSTLRANPNPGSGYSFDGKEFAQIIQDYQGGLFTKEEGIVHFGPMLVARGEGAEDKKSLANAAITIFDKSPVPTPVDTVGVYDGPYRYILNRVSEYAVTRASSAAWMRVAEEVKDASSSGSWLKAKPFHPTEHHHFFQMLNLWLQVVHAAGIANAVLVTTFLQDVVYDPMVEDGLEWHMVYCLLLVYLEAVEREHGATLANVFRRGGMDHYKKKAVRKHEEIYGEHFSTSRGQQARDLGSSSANTAKLEWCDRTKMYFNATSKIPCKHYNNGTPHVGSNLNADGSCNFLHACNAFTKVDGKRGKCLGKHPAGKDGKDCTNPHRVGA